MKYNKYLIITFPILIVLVSTFFYTKNIFYFYSIIPICVYVSFVRYYQEKNKLLIKTNKILNLLKYEFTIYTVAVLTIYSTLSLGLISKIKRVEYTYILYAISAALLLLTGVINIKRTLLIRKELRNNNSKWRKKEISSLSNWFLNFSYTKIFIKWFFYVFYSNDTY